MASSDLLIRPFTAEDAAAVAELYTRYPDSPNWVDRALDAAMVRTELAERGTVLFLVVEDAGEVLGTIGMFRGTGRRVVPEHEVVGDMFFLSPRVRGGALAGRLFTQAFVTLRELGVETIRLTVNPANQLALPLYRQLGCVVTGPAEAGEDGNIEMVSYMPKIVSRLRSEHAHLIPPNLPMAAAWRYQADGIATQALGKETERIGGRTVLRTALAVGELVFQTLLDPATGEILHTSVGAEPGEDPQLPCAPAAPEQRVTGYREGGYTLTVRHDDGAVHVHHDDWTGPLLQETWPVFGPAYLTGWRQALRRELTVRPLPDGWLVSERQQDGVLHRESRLVDAALHQRTWWTGGPVPPGPLRTLLVNGLRSALLLDGDGHRPAGRGLWPIDATEFGAARAELDPQPRLAWWEPGSRFTLRPHWPAAARAALVTDSLVTLDHPAEYAYHVELDRAELPGLSDGAPRPAAAAGLTPLPAEPAPVEPPAAPGPCELSDHSGPCEQCEPCEQSGQRPGPAPVAAGWEDRTVARRAVHRLTEGEQQLLLDPAAGGLVSWQSAGRAVLATPFPKSRAFARNPRWRAGLWVSGHGVREDENRGLGWGEVPEPAAWLFEPDGGGLDSPELSWTPTVTADGIAVTVRAPARAQDGELVVWLTPAAGRSPGYLVPGAAGEVWSLDKPGSWQRWTRAAAVELADGRWLAVTAGQPAHSRQPGRHEILLRHTPAGPLLALVARQPRGSAGAAHWPIAVLSGAAAARRHLGAASGALIG
ncbi:hypothetical protein GCM10009665_46850 [Kitasatospora nipponensis]|uniref:N-acetyltransferase domain-containing protein n=1 Tax=Kitasatospora nipponensis TaxID=258049 RepID=A0ABN1WIJ4_9ACTN